MLSSTSWRLFSRDFRMEPNQPTYTTESLRNLSWLWPGCSGHSDYCRLLMCFFVSFVTSVVFIGGGKVWSVLPMWRGK